MRKSLIIGIIVMLLSVAGLAGVCISVTAQDENISLTETVLVGDASYGEDISFRINSHWNERLLWEVETNIGKKTVTDAEFSFYPDGFEYEIPPESEAGFEYSMNFGRGSSHDLLDESDSRNIPFREVFLDVSSRTEPGETRKETVTLADYYEYFEMELYVRSEKYLRRYVGAYNGDENAYISDILGLQIPQGLQFEATVEKSVNGEVYNISGNAVEDPVRIISEGIVLADGIYIYVYAVDENGVLTDISEGGYGIYKIPLGRTQTNGEETAVMAIEEFALAYSIEEKILAMTSDEEEEELFLVIERSGEMILQRIDKEGMELLQEFSLGVSEEHAWCHEIKVRADGVLLLMSNRQLCFLEKQGDGYRMAVNYLMPEENYFTATSWGEFAFDYQNGRLAVIWADDHGHYNECNNSVYVFVIEGEELKFLAHYENSLDNKVGMYWDYDNKRHPGEPYEIWFEK